MGGADAAAAGAQRAPDRELTAAGGWNFSYSFTSNIMEGEMTDRTETARRERIAEIAEGGATREALEAEYGRVWSTDEMTADFEAVGFMAPFVVVRRRADGVVGSLEFRSRPRFYFNFVADKG